MEFQPWPGVPQHIVETLQFRHDLSRSEVFNYHYHRLCSMLQAALEKCLLLSLYQKLLCPSCGTYFLLFLTFFTTSTTGCNFFPFISPHTIKTSLTLMGVQLSLPEPRRRGSLASLWCPTSCRQSIISMPLKLSWPPLTSFTLSISETLSTTVEDEKEGPFQRLASVLVF